MIAYGNLLTGLNKLVVNEEVLTNDLDNHWEILAEPIQ
jgi:adenylosuccinate lyase